MIKDRPTLSNRLLVASVPVPAWSEVLWSNHRHGTLPLLYAQLRDDGDAPDWVMEQLAEHLATNARRRAAAFMAAEDALADLTAAGVPTIFTRVAEAIYPEPSIRELEPVDLLVPAFSFPRARQVMADAGYVPVHRVSPARESALRQAQGGLAFHHHGRRVRLHLNDSALPRHFDVGLDWPALWSRRVDRPLPSPSPEDAALLACAHGALHLWGKLVWLYDLARLLEGPLDWDVLCARAREGGAARILRLGLRLAHSVLGAELPPAIHSDIARDPDLAPLVASSEARLTDRGDGRAGELERSRFRVAVRDRASDRLAYVGRFAFGPTLDDWAGLPLPDSLFPLYYATRPARLALSAMGLNRAPRAPFVPTPLPVVVRLLDLAAVRPGDVVYDLGCGDGRIVVEAARRGARAIGVDLDPVRIAESRANARQAGVEERTSFVEADVADVDLADATVVAIWTLPTLNARLKPKLQSELAPGTRIVGHTFDFGRWMPSRTDLVSHDDTTVAAYLWTVDRPVVTAAEPVLNGTIATAIAGGERAASS